MLEYIFFARCIVSMSAFVGAAYVAAKGKDGWGWLIFAGLISLPNVSGEFLK